MTYILLPYFPTCTFYSTVNEDHHVKVTKTFVYVFCFVFYFDWTKSKSCEHPAEVWAEILRGKIPHATHSKYQSFPQCQVLTCQTWGGKKHLAPPQGFTTATTDAERKWLNHAYRVLFFFFYTFNFLKFDQWWHRSLPLYTDRSKHKPFAHRSPPRPHTHPCIKPAEKRKTQDGLCLLADGSSPSLPINQSFTARPPWGKSFYISTAMLLIVCWQLPGKGNYPSFMV